MSNKKRPAPDPSSAVKLNNNVMKELTNITEKDKLVKNTKGGLDFFKKNVEVKINNKKESLIVRYSPPLKVTDEIVINSFSQLERINKNCGITKYEERILNAVCTLINYHLRKNGVNSIQNGSFLDNFYISTIDIHHAMGYPNRDLSEAEENNIKEALWSLNNSFIHIDWEKERKARNIPEKKDIWGDSINLSRSLIRVLNIDEFAKMRPNKFSSKEVDVFRLAKIPPLFVYSYLTHQIISIPMNWFNISQIIIEEKDSKGNLILTRKKIRMTDERNAILHGICVRVHNALYFKKKGENPNEKNYNVIAFDKFFKDLGLEEKKGSRARSGRINWILGVLRNFKERSIISDFDDIKLVNRRKHSIRFFV